MLRLTLAKWELVWRTRAAAPALPLSLPPLLLHQLPSLLHQAQAVGVVLHSQLASHCSHGKPWPHLKEFI